MKRSKAKRELQRGEWDIRPAPFLVGSVLETVFGRVSESFGAALHYESLDLHQNLLLNITKTISTTASEMRNLSGRTL